MTRYHRDVSAKFLPVRWLWWPIDVVTITLFVKCIFSGKKCVYIFCIVSFESSILNSRTYGQYFDNLFILFHNNIILMKLKNIYWRWHDYILISFYLITQDLQVMMNDVVVCKNAIKNSISTKMYHAFSNSPKPVL